MIAGSTETAVVRDKICDKVFWNSLLELTEAIVKGFSARFLEGVGGRVSDRERGLFLFLEAGWAFPTALDEGIRLRSVMKNQVPQVKSRVKFYFFYYFFFNPYFPTTLQPSSVNISVAYALGPYWNAVGNTHFR